MKNFLKMEKTKTVILSLLMIVFGILFIALPEASFSVAMKVLSWIFIVGGIGVLVNYFVFFKVQLTATAFINGVIILLFGILLLNVPSIYVALIGFAFVFAGTQYVGTALMENRLGEKDWWKDLVYGVVQFVLGIVWVIMRYSMATQSAIMIYLGVSLILDGLFVLVSLFVLKREFKKLEKLKDIVIEQ